jgi:hypothetical protein
LSIGVSGPRVGTRASGIRGAGAGTTRAPCSAASGTTVVAAGRGETGRQANAQERTPQRRVHAVAPPSELASNGELRINRGARARRLYRGCGTRAIGRPNRGRVPSS